MIGSVNAISGDDVAALSTITSAILDVSEYLMMQADHPPAGLSRLNVDY